MKQYGIDSIRELFSILTPDEVAESLDNILFTATVHYLDPTTGGTVDKNVTDVNNVRFLLEALREIKQNA